MKNIKSLLLLVILSTFGFSSCQKDIVFVEGSGPGGTLPPSYTTKMSAKVDGVLVECEFAFSQTYKNSNGQIDLEINGVKNPQAFVFNFQNFKGLGTYNAADLLSGATYFAANGDAANNNYIAKTGTIKITTYSSKVIIGTFEFNGVNANGAVKNITEGTFVISLTTNTGISNANLSAKVDGAVTLFTAQGAYIKSAAVGNILTITGTNGNKVISLVIRDFKGSGTYEIDIDAQGAYNEDQSQNGSFATTSGIKSGKIIVTSSTATTLKGTFDFVAPNSNNSLTTTKAITEGKFDISYSTTTI